MTTKSAQSKPKTDVFTIINNRIIELLEKGTVPWKQPWKSAGPPRNMISGRSYRGLNILLLASLNYTSNLFLTLKQVNELGGRVKKGEHSSPVIFWSQKDQKEGVEKDKDAIDDLDEIYHEQLKTFLLTETDLNDYLQKSNEILQEKLKLLEIVVEESKKAKKKMEELLDMRLNGELNRETFPNLYRPSEERHLQLQDQIPELQAEIDFLQIEYFNSNTVIQEAQDLYGHWLNLPFEQKRNIVETITDSIVIGKEDITINLSYLPSLTQNGGKRERNLRVAWPLPT